MLLSLQKRRISFVAIVFITGSSAYARDWPQIQKSKTLRFCYTPWFGRRTSLSGLGPDIELAHAWARSLKIKSEAVKVDAWSELFQNESGQVVESAAYVPRLLRQEKCDFYASSMSQTAWRKNKLNISPIYPGRIMIVTKLKRKNDINVLKDLAGKKTGVVPNTTFHSWMLSQLQLDSDLKTRPFQIELLLQGGTVTALEKDQVDFILLDTAQAFNLLKENPSQYRIAFAIGDGQYVGWAFPHSAVELARKFTDFVKKQKNQNDSAMNIVYRKYFGVSANDFDSALFFSQSTRATTR